MGKQTKNQQLNELEAKKLKNKIALFNAEFDKFWATGVVNHGISFVPVLHSSLLGIVPTIKYFEASEADKKKAKEILEPKIPPVYVPSPNETIRIVKK